MWNTIFSKVSSLFKKAEAVPAATPKNKAYSIKAIKEQVKERQTPTLDKKINK